MFKCFFVCFFPLVVSSNSLDERKIDYFIDEINIVKYEMTYLFPCFCRTFMLPRKTLK